MFRRLDLEITDIRFSGTMFRFVRKLATAARNPGFSVLSDMDVAFFESVIGKNWVLTTGVDDYNQDWCKWYKGNSSCVLLPSSTEEISQLLAYCAQKKLAVVPQAGNTGMVGGSIPLHDEVVISVKRINQHFKFDENSGILECDAGFVFEDLDNKLESFGYMLPFDLGARGSCMIGGNVATCAGGIRLLRYGSLHAHLLGLTAVLPNDSGTVLKLGSSLRKDNTTLHTPHLFLGSEGQLGIITRVIITTVPRPLSVQSAMLGANSFEDCTRILKMAKSKLSEILSSFELVDQAAMTCVNDNLDLPNVLQSNPNFNLLIETSGSNANHDIEKLQIFLEECLNSGYAVDGMQAQSKTEASQMWKLREGCPLAVSRDGWVYKHDVSLPLEHFYELTEVMRSRCDGLAKRVVTYGHLGDGNSHLNITSKEFSQELYDRLYPYLYEWVVERGGSISAEHGIGQLKLPYVQSGKSAENTQLVRQLKAAFDPHGILNPYKMIY